MSLRNSTAKQLGHLYASISQVCRPAQKKVPATHPSDAMCLVEELHQKAEDSGGFDLDASPDFEELDLQFSEDAASAVVAALQCLGGERGTVLSHAGSSLRLKSGLHTDGETWLIMPVPEDCTFAIMCLGQEMGLFLAHWDGEVYLTPNSCELSPLQWYVEKQWDGYKICLLFKTFMDVSQSRLRQGVFAEGLPRSQRAVAVLD